METLYFTLVEQPREGYFAKVMATEIRAAVITAIYPYKRTGEELSLGLQFNRKDGVSFDFAYVHIQSNGSVAIMIKGENTIHTEHEAETLFLSYCHNAEYYNKAKELALKYGLIEYNHETDEQKSRMEQQEIMKYTAEQIEKEIGLEFADKEEASATLLKTIASELPKQFNDLSFNVMSDICDEILSTLKKKNDDYGNSYIKNIERFGKQAMLIPMFNKLDRLESLSKKENQNFESFEDSLRDLMGYCLMAIQHLIKTRGK